MSEDLEKRLVHVARSQSGGLGLFDEKGVMVLQLYDHENPEMVARSMGWRLVQPPK